MSDWVKYDFENRIRLILEDVNYDPADHHMNPPFLTAYQIALEFDARYPDVRPAMNLPIGGVDTGEGRSFSKYIANQLSVHIRSGQLEDIEGSFLSSLHQKELSYEYGEHSIVSSLKGSHSGVSQYRLRP